MAQQPALSATVVELEHEMKDYVVTPNGSFTEFERLFPGITIVATTRVLKTEFASAAAASEWCSDKSRRFPDSAHMYGEASEPLVKQYKMLRLNTGLYHILQYIWGGKLAFVDNKWSIQRTKPAAQAQLSLWINQYGLATPPAPAPAPASAAITVAPA